MKYNYNKEFIFEIPKSDLHLHLDGSLRLNTLIEFAKENKVQLPSYTESGLRELVFKDRYNNLGEYLQGFGYTTAVMRTEEAIERIAYELAIDSYNENVFYIEPRFAPQLLMNKSLTFEKIMMAANNGLMRAKKEINSSDAIKNGEKPAFNYGIIVCAMRMFTPAFSEYYNNFFELHKYSTKKEIFSLASLELAKATIRIINEYGIPIVGFDLAGQEDGYPAEDHKLAYAYCHKNFLKKTVHAGEAYGPESIFQAITDLYANRIGHGYYLFDVNKIQNPNINNKEEYIYQLSNYIADRRITIEVCLTSNMQTNPDIKDIKNHSLKKMLETGLSLTICTDNRLVSNTTVTDEVFLAVNNFDISPKKLKDIIIYGFKRNFYFGTYIEKRHYCRSIIDYYERIEKKYNIKKNE